MLKYKKVSTEELKEMHEFAVSKAKEAAALQESKDIFTGCGFAWVEAGVDGRSAFSRELKKIGFKPSHMPRKMNYWNPSRHSSQDVTVKEMGAQAYAQVMNTLLETTMFYAGSRLD